MRARLCSLIVLALLLVNTTVQAQVVPCPTNYAGYLSPRLQVGAQARVELGTAPNRIRDTPQTTGTQIGSIDAGGVAEVIFGPSCDSVSQIIWWQVRFNNVVGWTAEGVLPDDYFLEPVVSGAVGAPPAGAATLPDERSTITLANVSDLAPVLALPVSRVKDIAFNADQSLIAFASFDNGARVYMLPTLFEEPMLTNPAQGATAVAFSPDGRYFAYGLLDDRIIIANLENAGSISDLANPPTAGVNALAFSPDDSNRLAVASGQLYGGLGVDSAGLYDVSGNRLIVQFPAGFWVNNVAFNNDGTQFAWVDTALHVYDIHSDSEILNISVPAPGFGAIAYTPDDRLAYTNANAIVLLSSDPKIMPMVYNAVSGLTLSTIAFNPDGTLLAVLSVPGAERAGGSVIAIFDVESGESVFQQGSESARTLAFSPDGTLLVIADNEAVSFLAVNE